MLAAGSRWAAFLYALPSQDVGPGHPKLFDAVCHVSFADPAKADVDLGVLRLA